MHQILVWPLSDTLKIMFVSPRCDLGTITCCDELSMILQHQDQTYQIASNVVGCSFSKFKELLVQFLAREQTHIAWSDTFFLSMDRCDNILLEIRQQDRALCYQIISLSMVQSWIAQLDLLHVLMEENENEKKSRGKGCC